jgi:mono/diheme cytochrome c family protein
MLRTGIIAAIGLTAILVVRASVKTAHRHAAQLSATILENPARPVGATPVTLLADAPAAVDTSKLEQGLTLTITPAGGDATAADSRPARLVSLYVPAGAAPSAFVPPGRFVATWEGYINVRIRDYYIFSAEGRGKLTVNIDDKPALEVSGEDFAQKPGDEVKLSKGKGKNHLVVRYESPEQGDAAVRLFWVMRDDTVRFFDPVPPRVFTHDPSAQPIATGTRLREGRLLLAEMRCMKCHTTPESLAATAGAVAPGGSAHAKLEAMPELSMDAPALSDAGARLNAAWIAAWVNNPRALRPDSHMPRLFSDEKTPKDAIDPRAADVAAYLATLGGAPAVAKDPADAAVEAGGRLFTNFNCIACHSQPSGDKTPPDASADAASTGEGGNAAAFPRIPLANVAVKYHPEALKQFLLKPEAHYAWIRMPNFRLSEEEASELAAFLLKEPAGKVPGSSQGNADNGKKLVESSGCLNCHAIGDEKSALKAPTLAEIPKDAWDKGCLAKDDASRKTAPQYELTDDQRSAIAAFAATDRSSLKRDAAPEFAERQIASLHCTSCHMRDGLESLLATTYDDELKALRDKYPNPPPASGAESFAPDQRAPLITWAGEKLRPEWMEKFIEGQVPYKPRTYLYARMPGFVARGGLIADGLAEEHGCELAFPDYPKPDPAQAVIGQKLVGKTPNQAFACVQCHAVANIPPFAPFEAPALNFMYVRERLRKDYYHRWVHNPIKIDPNTKMPAFERDDGKTSITTVLDGDARKQFEAIWQYLLNGRDIKPPAE